MATSEVDWAGLKADFDARLEEWAREWEQNYLAHLEKDEGDKPASLSQADGNEPVEHEYSSTQFDLDQGGYSRSQGSPVPLIREAAEAIPDEDLAEDGREKRPHVTVKYGLHTSDPDEVRRIVEGYGPVRITLGGVGVFPASETETQYDVVKIDVEGLDIFRLNKLLSVAMPHTDTHPHYQPHVTLAYVKPGLGLKYKGDWLGKGMEMILNALVFSDQEGNETVISLNNKRDVALSQSSDPQSASPIVDAVIERGLGAGLTISEEVRAAVRRRALGLKKKD